MWARGQLHPDADDDAHDPPDPDEGLDAAAAAFGLRIVGAPAAPAAPPTFALWPSNVPAWCAWLAVQTQWRHAAVGMAGSLRTGLDYAGVCAWLQANHYSPQFARGPRSLARALDDLRACEAVAIDEWARQAARHHRG